MSTPPTTAQRPLLFAITLENFRGVRDPLTIELNASAVLLWGPNGTGKTTIFDAILWLVRGDIPRLSDLTMRRNEEYVSSTYRRGHPSTVTVELRTPDQIITATRHGQSRDNYLELKAPGVSLSGDAAADALRSLLVGGQMSLPDVLRTSGLLQQDDLRLLLRDKPDLRYRQLLRLLGLEVLEAAERLSRTWANDARSETRRALQGLEQRQKSVAAAQEEAETARLQLNRATQGHRTKDLLGPTLATIDGIVQVAEPPSSAEALPALAAETDGLTRRVRGTLALLNDLPSELPAAPADEARLLQEQAQAETDVQRAEELVVSAEQSRQALLTTQDTLNSLAALAIPLLQQGRHGDPELTQCPVCRTEVDADSVTAELQERAQLGAAIAAADSALSSALSAASEARARRDRVGAMLEAGRAARRERGRLEQAVANAANSLSALTAGPRVRLRLPRVADATVSEWGETVLVRLRDPAVVDTLQSALRELEVLTASLSSATEAAHAARIAAERASQLPKIEARLASLREQMADAQRLYDETRKEEVLTKSVADGASASIADIFRERFSTLEPLMNNVYARLDPHPAFTRLDFKVETYRARGTATASVTDEEADVSANPLLVFSSAQANIVVLAAFLALGWAAGSDGLPFVLMDDPLQALDDVNVLGFADLARHLRRQRQVVLATHEERFARALERKLTGRREHEDLLIHRFRGWSREGPQIETRRIPGTSAPDLRVLAS